MKRPNWFIRLGKSNYPKVGRNLFFQVSSAIIFCVTAGALYYDQGKVILFPLASLYAAAVLVSVTATIVVSCQDHTDGKAH